MCVKGLDGCHTNINFKKPYPLAKGNSTYDHKSRELLTLLGHLAAFQTLPSDPNVEAS